MKILENTPTNPPDQINKEQCEEALISFRTKLFELQNKFYADGRFGLLIILQGMDTSGKDGVIRHVMTCMNPMGLQVKSFKKPTEEELKHDFMWRIYPHLPSKGMIQVFNRSYYEDILVPTVNKSLPQERLQHRYQLINELEKHLMLNDICILKFFLHISKEEQKEKIKERLSDPQKQWKYSDEDKRSSENWDAYTEVYNKVLKSCNEIPWQIIPAGSRWYRNYLVAKILMEYLEKLDLNYPTNYL